MTHPAYISDTFLLESPLAQQLYQSYASNLPIIDFHTHLEASDIYHDRSYSSIADAWLSGDHYLWRAMRSVGINEHFITGSASEYDKFCKWCEAMPFLIGSPLYQWCHLELKRFFQLDLLLCPENCQTIWQHCNQRLKSGDLSARQILIQNNVDTLCTTDDPLSDLQFHHLLAKEQFPVNVLPTFRADGLINTQNSQQFRSIIHKLTAISRISINGWSSFQQAIKQRIDYFHANGCRLSDVGINQLEMIKSPLNNTDDLFNMVLNETEMTLDQHQQLRANIFHFLAQEYHQKNWTMQLHIGVMPNVNQRRLDSVGVGTGFSIMHDGPITQALAERLSRLDSTEQLPQTVLYNLNPKDTWPLASLIGAFQDSDSAAGKIQLGAAWWFNDHKHGMVQQMTALANLGSLGKFIGMLTDSRSALSLSRHEYFRRVLCNLLAQWAMSGDIPNDSTLLKQTIENICYHNAKNYFKF